MGSDLQVRSIFVPFGILRSMLGPCRLPTFAPTSEVILAASPSHSSAWAGTATDRVMAAAR